MRKAILAAVVAAALVLAACGGDDDDAGDDAAGENPPSETIAAGGGGGSSSTTAAGASDGGGAGGNLACDVDASIASIGTLVANLFLRMGDPAAVEQGIGDLYAETDDLADRMRAAADEAPEEIRDDIEFVVGEMAPLFDDMPSQEEVMAEVREAIAARDAAGIQEAFSSVTAGFAELESDPEFEEATANIEAWVAENC